MEWMVIVNFTYDEEVLEQKAELLKALAHPVRLCILQGLAKQGACCPSEIQACLNIPQSTLSQHLGRLRQAGIVRGTRHGLEIHYELIDSEVIALLDILLADKE